jgi:hypothetical protein
MEHMRKGEKALIMVKPRWGYAMEQYKDDVLFPTGWDEGEKKETLLTRRAFYEVTLHSWVVRHDLNSDAMFMKTINERGKGYDRVDVHDNIKLDLVIKQDPHIFVDVKDEVIDMKNPVIYDSVFTIL